MPSMKMLRRRLASVTTTKKIMKAMNMVAASKLQKNRHRLEHARPFFNDVRKTMESLKTDERVSDNIFLTPRPVKNTAYLVVTGDRGLCGSFNINAAEHALNHMNASPASTDIIAVGLKGRSYFQRHGKHILMGYDDVLETAFYEDAEFHVAFHCGGGQIRAGNEGQFAVGDGTFGVNGSRQLSGQRFFVRRPNVNVD